MAWVTSLLFGVAAFVAVRVLLKRSDQTFHRLVPKDLMKQAVTELPAKHMHSLQRFWTVMLIGLVVTGWVLRILPITTVLVGVWLMVPRWLLAWQLHRRRLKLRDQLVGAMQNLANSARAGQSLAQGLESLSHESPEPLADELRQMMGEYQLGRPLPDTIMDTKQRLQLDSFSLFASTVVISLRQGGRVTESLERISNSLRENQRVERKLDAETAGGWRVVLILTLFPFLFLAGFYVLHPEGTLLMFRSLIGQALIITIIGLVVTSVWWSRKILNIEL